MLSDLDIYHLSKQMKISKTIECFYKDNLKSTVFEPEKAYIINLASETDDNFGTHYTLLYSKYHTHEKEGKAKKCLEYIYFDAMGANCPIEVIDFVNLPYKIPFTDKNIQGKFNNSCGFYCLAFLYYLTTFKNRLDSLYCDTEMFLNLFDDTEEKVDTLHNEMMLKEFFKQMPTETIETKYIKLID